MLKLQNFKEHGNKIVFRLCNAVLKALNSNKTLFVKFTYQFAMRYRIIYSLSYDFHMHISFVQCSCVGLADYLQNC